MGYFVLLYWAFIFIIAQTEIFQPFEYYFNGITWGCFGASLLCYFMFVDFKSKGSDDAKNASGIAIAIIITISLMSFGR